MKCANCEGSGKFVVFDGVFMQANPSSYGDYEEVWDDCPVCKGSGKSWDRYSRMYAKQRFIYWLHEKFGLVQEEDEIPF